MGALDLETRVIALLKSALRVSEPIDSNSELSRDFKIDGDDATEFLDLYAKEFDVDMSTFEFDTFFGPEAGPSPITLLLHLLRRRSRKIPIRVGDLILAAERKKWILVR